MEKGLISIIVPVYNAEKYLKHCIESLLVQSYGEIEIIAINDGSTDKSLKILEVFKKKDERIKVFSQSNKGISETRNTGLRYSRGEFIMFVDSDDWIESQTCERAITKLKEANADVVLWSYMREYSNTSKPTAYFGKGELKWEKGSQKELWRRMIGPIKEELGRPQTVDSMITVWGKLYKKSVLKDKTFVDTNIIGTEDLLFNVQVFSQIQTAAYIPDILYHYRKNDLSSFTHLYKKEKAEQWKNLYKRIYAVLKENSVGKEFYKALENRICLGLIGLGLNLVEDKTISMVLKRNELKQILSRPYYKNALKKLDLSYFPIPWKLFFFLAKQGYLSLLIVMLCMMNRLRKI